MRLTVLVCLIYTAIGTTVYASGTAISIAKEKWPADQRIELSLVSMGEKPEASPAVLPEKLSCLLDNDGRSYMVTARRIPAPEGPDSDNSGGSESALYAFEPPGGISGAVSLR